MKNKLLSLLLIATTICAIPEAVGQTKDTLTNKYLNQRDDGLFYQEQNKKPFNGVILLDEYNKEVIEYVKGEKVHHTIWYENGQKQSEYNYANNEEEGPQTEWYENGQKTSVYNYVNGEQNGLQTYWHENGQKQSEETYKSGQQKGNAIEWYDNGQKKQEGKYKNGRENGKVIAWYENGKIESEGSYKEGQKEGQWIQWYETGQKKEEVTFVNSKPESVIRWHENGAKASEYIVNYMNGQPQSELATMFFIDGTKASLVQNKMIDRRRHSQETGWYQNGQKRIEENYVNGLLEGLQTEWFQNGQKKLEENYVLDRKEGRQIQWSENGEVLKEEIIPASTKGNRTFIPGYGLYITPPNYFARNSQHGETFEIDDRTIFNEDIASFSVSVENIDKSEYGDDRGSFYYSYDDDTTMIEISGTKYHLKEVKKTTVDGYPALYVIRDSIGHIVMKFGDSTFTATMGGSYPANDTLLREEIFKSFLTASYKKNNIIYARLFFSLDDSESKFKTYNYNKRRYTNISYSIDGVELKGDEKGEPTILITSSVKSNNNYEHPRSAGRKDPLKQNVLNQGAMEYVEIMYKELEISSKANSEMNGYEYDEVIGSGFDWVGEKKQFYVQKIKNKHYEITVWAQQTGGELDVEEIRKLINTIKFK